jgi:hypothetical protein
MTVTLRMVSNSLRSSPVINAHLPIDQAGRITVLIKKKVWKNGGNHPLSEITPEFFIQGVTYLLKNESYMYSTYRREWSVIVTVLIIRRVTVKWETVKSRIFWIKTWKWHQNRIKICSGNPTFLWSNTWNPLYPFLISWHCPFKETNLWLSTNFM